MGMSRTCTASGYLQGINGIGTIYLTFVSWRPIKMNLQGFTAEESLQSKGWILKYAQKEYQIKSGAAIW